MATSRLLTKPIRALAEGALELKRRHERSELEPLFDWYATSCPCGEPPGECKKHPRARPNERRDGALFGQRPPEIDPENPWEVWLFAGGRGTGKTITGAQWVRHRVESGIARHIALVSETVKDVRDVMIEGPAGLLKISPPWCMPVYEPSKARVVWPNGAVATMFSAERPDQLRGPQHDTGWLDEIAKWQRAQDETWDNFNMGLRLGDFPQCAVTTTPRPTKTYKKLIANENGLNVITRGSTFENTRHLAPSFIKRMAKQYGGTRLGRQELEAELLADNPNALWRFTDIDDHRRGKAPELIRIVVAIDPSAGSLDPDSAAEAGIIVAGVDHAYHGYILADRSLKGSPEEWSKAAVGAYREFHADRIVAETNNGGDMVEAVLRSVDRSIPFRKLWASRGKLTRAEPIAALYERHEVHHVGTYAELESQMTDWEPGMPSPDRMDAAVWALTDLIIDGGSPTETEDDPFGGHRI